MDITPRKIDPTRVCIRTSFESFKEGIAGAFMPRVMDLKPGERVEIIVRRAGESSWGDFLEIERKEDVNTNG